MIDPVFRSNPLDCRQSPAYHPPPYISPSLVLSLIFPTWVMAFVIPDDSRNKSTVMRSHWVIFSFLCNHPSQLLTANLFLRLRLGPGSSQPAWNRSIPSWGRPPCSQNGHPVLLPLLSFDSLELISWLNAARYVSKLLPYDILSIFIDLFSFSRVCICGPHSSLICDNAFIYNRRGMCARLHERPHNDACFSWLWAGCTHQHIITICSSH